MIKLLEDRRFYVYIYLDPRKPGNYKYDGYEFDYEPIYVGKGKDNRYKAHLSSSNNDNNKIKINKIKKIIRETGKEPIINIFSKMLTEKEAYDLEIKIIKTIGRIDLKTGILTNCSDGGEGLKNKSIEVRRKISIANKNRSLEFKKMIGKKGGLTKKLKRQNMSLEELEDLRKKNREKTLSFRAKIPKEKLEFLEKRWIYNRKGKKDSELIRKRKSKGHIKYVFTLTSEERKEKYGHNKNMIMSEEQKQKIRDTKKRNSQIVSDETRKKLSKALKGRKFSEESKKKMSEIRKRYWENKRKESNGYNTMLSR